MTANRDFVIQIEDEDNNQSSQLVLVRTVNNEDHNQDYQRFYKYYHHLLQRYHHFNEYHLICHQIYQQYYNPSVRTNRLLGEEYLRTQMDRYLIPWLQKNDSLTPLTGNLLEFEELLKLYANIFELNIPSLPHSRQRSDSITDSIVLAESPKCLCLIVLNEERLLFQAVQFKLLFESLKFRAPIRYGTSQDIKKWFQQYGAVETGLDALVTIVISHGRDGIINGIDRNNGYNDQDYINISELINVFSDPSILRDFPVINIFDCCRISQYSLNTNPSKLGFNQLVIFSCDEGQYSYFSPNIRLFTNFGVELSRCLARYVFDYPFTYILNWVAKNLHQLRVEERPRIHRSATNRYLFFNPY